MDMTRCAVWFDVDDLPCDASSPAASGMPEVATEWIYHSTGRRFPGECTTFVRPTLTCGHSDLDWCDCRARWRRIDLTRWIAGPVTAIDELVIAGSPVASGDIADSARIDNGSYLTPITGGELWPWPTQDMNRADGDEDTWSITVTHGQDPPAPVVQAAKDLACQLAKRANGKDCDLPDNATSISDNGVSINLAVPEGGKTGIPSIDSVLEAYGAGRIRRRIFNPNSDPARTYRV